MTSDAFRQISETIPHLPGIYKYFDARGALLYVGKAKDLRKRVSSYFTKTLQSYKTHELVRRIHRIEFTVVDTEQDAFFLENALIKEHQPRFNIDLKDDKSYPYIVIKKEPFPRVFLTRRKIADGSEYLGPFTSVARVRELLQFIRQHVQLRTCKLPLTSRNIAAGKFKLCLEYHLGNCKGPCVGLQTEEDYQQGLQRLRQILKGRLTEVQQHYKAELQQHVAELAFEKAERVRQKLEHLESFRSSSVIVGRQNLDADVFHLLRDGNMAYVNYLMVRGGTVVQTHTLQLNPHLDETEAEVLAFAVAQIRDTFNSDAPEVIVPIPIEYGDPSVQVKTAKTGERKKLLDLSEKNVRIFMEEIRRRKMLYTEKQSDDDRQQVLQELQEWLHLPEPPTHIECFDNSNFHGSYPVAAMVCFRDGLPSKNDYRRFHIKTVTGINDFASMQEVVGRRYRKLDESGEPFPQLVIIDGGKGQLNAAMQALSEAGLTGRMTVVGLAKQEEEIFFPGDRESIRLPWDSSSLKLIRRIRDEVHRFGITFHRQQRSKGTFRNPLEDIPGIGKATAEKLLTHFRSVRKLREADSAEISRVVGPAKAQQIRSYFEAARDNPDSVSVAQHIDVTNPTSEK